MTSLTCHQCQTQFTNFKLKSKKYCSARCYQEKAYKVRLLKQQLFKKQFIKNADKLVLKLLNKTPTPTNVLTSQQIREERIYKKYFCSFDITTELLKNKQTILKKILDLKSKNKITLLVKNKMDKLDLYDYLRHKLQKRSDIVIKCCRGKIEVIKYGS